MDLGAFDADVFVDAFWDFIEQVYDDMLEPAIGFVVDLFINNADDIAYLCVVLGFSVATRSWLRRSRT